MAIFVFGEKVCIKMVLYSFHQFPRASRPKCGKLCVLLHFFFDLLCDNLMKSCCSKGPQIGGA